MARPIKDRDGKRNRIVSLALTQKLFDDVADMSHLQRVSFNDFVIGCLQKVTDKNSAKIADFRAYATANAIDDSAD